jgi:hypothetical protein
MADLEERVRDLEEIISHLPDSIGRAIEERTDLLETRLAAILDRLPGRD